MVLFWEALVLNVKKSEDWCERKVEVQKFENVEIHIFVHGAFHIKYGRKRDQRRLSTVTTPAVVLLWHAV